MSKAFGIITKLDKCDTPDLYLKHKESSIEAYKNAGFLPDNIFCVCSIYELFKNTPNLDTTNKNHLDVLEGKFTFMTDLPEGLLSAKAAITYQVKHELPFKRLNQTNEIALWKLIPLVCKAIDRGRSIIPHNINDEDTLKTQLDDDNNVQWGEIFRNERFGPTIIDANEWKNNIIKLEKEKAVTEIKSTFKKILSEFFTDDSFIYEKNRDFDA